MKFQSLYTNFNKNVDIYFELWLTIDTKIDFNGKVKYFIEYIPTIGLHFYAGNKDDNQIKNEINVYMMNKNFI